MRIRNKIVQLAGAEYGTLGSVFAVEYAQGYVLIDSGMPDAIDVIRMTMDYWGIDERKITHVFFSHGHDDHCGNAAYFQSLGAKIYIGKEDAPMLEAGNLGMDSPCTNHVMPCCRPDYLIGRDERYSIGDCVIEAYKMPGHTDGTVLYVGKIEGETVIFSGDFFFPEGERGDMARTGWKGDLSYNSSKLTESFRRLYIMDLKPDIILSSHGRALFGEKAKDCVRTAFKYHILNNR